MAVKGRVISLDVGVQGSSYTFLATVKFVDGATELTEEVFRESASNAPASGQITPIIQGLAKQVLKRRNELQASRNAVRDLVPEIIKGLEKLI
jgi:hypothetical protein